MDKILCDDDFDFSIMAMKNYVRQVNLVKQDEKTLPTTKSEKTLSSGGSNSRSSSKSSSSSSKKSDSSKKESDEEKLKEEIKKP